METIEKLLGNNKPQKIVIEVRDIAFDFTRYSTNLIIKDDDVEILNVYAETLVASKDQKNKNVLEIPVVGNNISVKIEKNYDELLIVDIYDI
jgi:hypothetical protein